MRILSSIRIIIVWAWFPIFSSLMECSTTTKSICWSILEVHLVLDHRIRACNKFSLVIILYHKSWVIFLIGINHILLHFSISISSLILTNFFKLFLSYHFWTSILFNSSSSFFYLLLTLVHKFDRHFNIIGSIPACEFLIVKGIKLILRWTLKRDLTRSNCVWISHLLWGIKFFLSTILRFHYAPLGNILLVIHTFISSSLKVSSISRFFWHNFLCIGLWYVKFISMSSWCIHY